LEGTNSKNNLPHKVATVGNRSALHKVCVAEIGSDRGGTSKLVLRSSLQSDNINSPYCAFEIIKTITFMITYKNVSLKHN
jgi:hypothetical protein